MRLSQRLGTADLSRVLLRPPDHGLPGQVRRHRRRLRRHLRRSPRRPPFPRRGHRGGDGVAGPGRIRAQHRVASRRAGRPRHAARRRRPGSHGAGPHRRAEERVQGDGPGQITRGAQVPSHRHVRRHARPKSRSNLRLNLRRREDRHAQPAPPGGQRGRPRRHARPHRGLLRLPRRPRRPRSMRQATQITRDQSLDGSKFRRNRRMDADGDDDRRARPGRGGPAHALRGGGVRDHRQGHRGGGAGGARGRCFE